MKWNGEYKYRCPKCKGRTIWVYETIEAISQHLIRNGEWIQSEDNNEYGDGIRVDCRCDDCGHRWIVRGAGSMDYILKD